MGEWNYIRYSVQTVGPTTNGMGYVLNSNGVSITAGSNFNERVNPISAVFLGGYSNASSSGFGSNAVVGYVRLHSGSYYSETITSNILADMGLSDSTCDNQLCSICPIGTTACLEATQSLRSKFEFNDADLVIEDILGTNPDAIKTLHPYHYKDAGTLLTEDEVYTVSAFTGLDHTSSMMVDITMSWYKDIAGVKQSLVTIDNAGTIVFELYHLNGQYCLDYGTVGANTFCVASAISLTTWVNIRAGMYENNLSSYPNIVIDGVETVGAAIP